MNDLKTYIGDSVYADYEHGQLVITTENGYGPSNTIYLEPECLYRLVAYYERAAKAHEVAREMIND